MAAAAMVDSSPSSLVGDTKPKELENELNRLPKPQRLASNPDPKKLSERSDLSTSDNENEPQNKDESQSSPLQKPNEMAGSMKKVPIASISDDYKLLSEGYIPSDEDVICSWARQNHSHPGNEKFRIMINKYAPTYMNVSTKYQKSEVIAKIVAEVRSKSPGGGFVKKDFYSNRWFEVGDEKARDKVGHAIRKAALALEKKMNGEKRQRHPQSLAKQVNNQIQYERGNMVNMNFDLTTIGTVGMNSHMNKAAIMNCMNSNTGLSGFSNDMNLSEINMNNMGMNMNMGGMNNIASRTPLAGMPNMGHNSSIMNTVGMNTVGLGMNSVTPGSYSRELEEMMVMNRLRADIVSSGGNSNTDRFMSGGLYANSPNDAMGLSGSQGVNTLNGIDDTTVMEEIQRRRSRFNAVTKRQENMNALLEPEQMSRWPKMDGNRLSSISPTNMNNIIDRSNTSIGLMGISSIGGSPGHIDSNNNMDMASSNNTFLSKLAAGNSIRMNGASNGSSSNNNAMFNSMMTFNDLSQGSSNNSMGNNNDDNFASMSNHSSQAQNRFSRHQNNNFNMM